jgi:thioredoxin-dependent peroxiredoxin
VNRTLITGALALALSLSACGAQQRPDGGTGLLPVGMSVPNLSQADQRGSTVRLREHVPTLVYFYPRSGTPGCTREACAFRDTWKRYSDAGLRVVGVSGDDADHQREFADEHELPFSLIADENHVWSKAFGVGSFMSMDARRSFLVAPTGEVVKVYEDVDPGVHAKEVLDDAQKLGILVATGP